jgi:hypothetical protein
MKDNIIKEPLNIDKKGKYVEEINIESWVIDDDNTYDHNKDFPKFVNSWDKINKVSSLISKISVDNAFMKWLLNK